MESDWPGSRWWRVDLHTHTPASFDFDDQDNADWDYWIATAASAGLEVIAVTDHNTAEAIQHLQDAANTAPQAPIIFPGVELTASDGTHLLLLIDPRQSERHVEDILSTMGLGVDQRGRQQSRSSLSIEAILDSCPSSCLVIAAHANDENGLLTLSGLQREGVLKHPRLAAVEVDPTKDLEKKWIDGSMPQIGKPISTIWSSDSHSFAKMGRRFTWMKMSQPNLEGLRLALLDGPNSLIVADRGSANNPNRNTNQLIEKIVIRDAKHIGRSRPLEIKFSPWMNAFIGGRGTGKSTLVDFFRATLRRESELDAITGGEDGPLRVLFNKRMSVPKSRVSEGLVLLNTSIEVWYQKDGERFVLGWSQDGSANSIARINGEERIQEDGSVVERFPVRIYSQKQIFELAQNPDSLLTVIDDSREVNRVELNRLMEAKREKFLSLLAASRSAYSRCADLPRLNASLEDVQRKLKVLQEGSQQETFEAFRERRELNSKWTDLVRTTRESIKSLSNFADQIEVNELTQPRSGKPDAAAASIHEARTELFSTVEDLRKYVSNRSAAALRRVDRIEKSPIVKLWNHAFQESKKSFENASSELADLGISDPSEYEVLLDQVSRIKKEIDDLEKVAASAKKLEGDAKKTLVEIRNLREDLTRKRSEFARQHSGRYIDVQVNGCANSEQLVEELASILGIERFEEDRQRIADRIVHQPDQPWSWENLDCVISDLNEFRSNESGEWDARDRRFNAALKSIPPERLDRLALYSPRDSVEVRFKEGESRRMRSLEQGSPGQQSAALLSFVLAYGSEPIILDQPEDDLDNKLIYDLVVNQLRESKSKRQIILVTHNANIVVHGNAELVLPIDARSGQSYVVDAGGLQESHIRNEICRIMEGGEEAFRSRYERIMPAN